MQQQNCRICLQEVAEAEGCHPCGCSGSMGQTHLACLKRHLALKRAPQELGVFVYVCQLCNYPITYEVDFANYRCKEASLNLLAFISDLSLSQGLIAIIIAGVLVYVSSQLWNLCRNSQPLDSLVFAVVLLTLALVLALGCWWAIKVVRKRRSQLQISRVWQRTSLKQQKSSHEAICQDIGQTQTKTTMIKDNQRHPV